LIEVSAQTDSDAGGQQMAVQFNGDTTVTNYSRAYHFNGAAVTAGQLQSHAHGFIGYKSNGASGDCKGTYRIEVFDVDDATKWTQARSEYIAHQHSVTDLRRGEDGLSWRNTAAVTTVRVITRDTVNMTVGSYCRVYGIKNEVVVTDVSGGSASGWKPSPTAVKTGAHTAADNEVVLCDTSGGAFTVTLPPSVADLRIVVKLVTAGSDLTVDGDSAELIDGAAAITLNVAGQARTFLGDGTGWVII
jgi:hypothetical protein